MKHAKPDLSYEMDVGFDDGDHLVVAGPFAMPERLDLGYTTFEVGDHFVEHYWRSRWYSIKEIHDPSRGLKGWYCDVTRPASVVGTRITSVDLELDVWVPADGSEVLLLDYDEFVDSGLAETDPYAAAHALAARDALQRGAADRFATLCGRGNSGQDH